MEFRHANNFSLTLWEAGRNILAMFKLDGPTLRRALQKEFDAGTLAKGRVYQQQHRVLNFSVAPGPDDCWAIAAEVQGSRPKPYEVTAEVADLEDGLLIDGDCSCPMKFDCKHVAAAMLHVADQPGSWSDAAMGGDGFSDGDLFPFLSSQSVREPKALNPQLQAWLKTINSAAAGDGADKHALPATEASERLLYILRPQYGQLRLDLSVVRLLKKGGYGKPRNCYINNLLQHTSAPRFACSEDLILARKIMLAQPMLNTFELWLKGAEGAELLPELLTTGRCHWRGSSGQHPALTLGGTRPARPVWNVDNRGFQRPAFRVNPPVTEVLPLSPLWYVDSMTGECGRLETDLPPAVAAAWLNAPTVAPQEAVAVAVELSGDDRPVALPAPQGVEIADLQKVKPTPCLRLYSAKFKPSYYSYGWPPKNTQGQECEIAFAQLGFDYAGTRIESHVWKPVLEQFAEGKLTRVRRDTRAEEKAQSFLREANLAVAGSVVSGLNLGAHANAFTCVEEDDWFDFLHVDVPELRQRGWRIDIEDSFHLQLAEAESWFTDATPEGHDWFDVELGVMVEGEKINLLPVLLKVLQADRHLLNAEELAQMSDSAVIPVPLPDGRKLMFPAGRARQMLGVLLELLNPDALNADGQLRLPKLRALELAGEADWRWLGHAELRELCTRLRNFSGVKPVAPPPNLKATLRPYQQDGLNWLQFLREYELAGVLADDMGLGKTVQALAHLLVEKESGRMDKPSLVVAPTSLMTNWRQEAERFAPDLRVLVLHGLDRKQHFDRIAGHDLIVTSYPLLPRDHEVLREQEFHCLILDEAQFIKNPKTQYAQVACALKARHHLCLTGTPMENHLGELWSLFHFLLPGFLGDQIRFNSAFRRPIEKGKDDERRKLLARRVGPFILRRKKEEVVKELPPKTEIVQNIELAGAQRDLYESVRLAMHQRVKEEVNKKGLSRAHIIILDALLKLRQICCHPQLLSLPSAKKVKESAKLELLMDLLPEMIEEGRRVLLFSQFTSMLALIENRLGVKKIPYVQLTGSTRDRATPVNRFQAGEVPVFLISLKAGGTGLNLTAADTVIHYDPWWNPAVESQATDRAHRIGQDKKVFVYKLMTVGTVEEKIGAMQARKRELVEGLLNEERSANLKLTAEDLDVLFAPLD